MEIITKVEEFKDEDPQRIKMSTTIEGTKHQTDLKSPEYVTWHWFKKEALAGHFLYIARELSKT